MRRSRFQRHVGHKNTICSMRMHRIVPFFMKNRQKLSVFWSKIEFFDFRQAVEDPPPYLGGAGCEQAGGRGKWITRTEFAACVCTKVCHFSSKKWPFSGQKLSLLATDKQ